MDGFIFEIAIFGEYLLPLALSNSQQTMRVIKFGPQLQKNEEEDSITMIDIENLNSKTNSNEYLNYTEDKQYTRNIISVQNYHSSEANPTNEDSAVLMNMSVLSKNVTATFSHLFNLLEQDPIVRKFSTMNSLGTKAVEISHDGKTLYYGGEGGLVVFKRKSTDQSFRLYKENKNIKYFALRSTPSGHIVVQRISSSDL